MNKALFDISEERRRQIGVEGWSYEHDDQYSSGELARAASLYAANAAQSDRFRDKYNPKIGKYVPETWPWAAEWWKPKDRRRDLVRAAALLVAEIERLDRKEETSFIQEPARPWRLLPDGRRFIPMSEIQKSESAAQAAHAFMAQDGAWIKDEVLNGYVGKKSPRDTWDEGYEAAIYGSPSSACEWPAGGDIWKEWMRGYKQGSEDIGASEAMSSVAKPGADT